MKHLSLSSPPPLSSKVSLNFSTMSEIPPWRNIFYFKLRSLLQREENHSSWHLGIKDRIIQNRSWCGVGEQEALTGVEEDSATRQRQKREKQNRRDRCPRKRVGRMWFRFGVQQADLGKNHGCPGLVTYPVRTSFFSAVKWEYIVPAYV